MSAKICALLAPAVMVGFLIGWMARGPGDSRAIVNPTDPGNGASPAPEPVDAIARELGDRAGRYREERSESDGDDLLQVAPDAVTALLGAKVTSLEERSQLIQTGNPLEQLIDTSEEEAATLNDFWDRLKPGVDDVRLENLKHQRLDDGGIWMGIEPFPEQGETFRVDFHRRVLEVLGESRGQVFLNCIGAHHAFGNWGKTVGTGFTIHMVVEEDGSLLYEIQEQTAADGTPGRRWNTSRIPAHLSAMAEAVGISLSP